MDPITLSVNGKRYKVLKVLGKGAFGVTFGCRDSLGVPVAIKRVVVSKDNVSALISIKRETTILKKMAEYPNTGVLRFIDWEYLDGTDSVTYFIVSEWIRGDTIRGYISKRLIEKMTPLELIDIMIQVTSAINFLHDIGIVHRDIKVENTMLVPGRKPIVKIIDFGFAALYHPNVKTPGMSETEHIRLYNRWCNTFTDKWLICDTTWKGTPSYIAPELWNKEVPKTQTYLLMATDVFATGCMFYRLMNGKSPWNYVMKNKENRDILGREISGRSYTSPTSAQREGQRARNEVSSQSGIPELDIIINYMLSKNPEDRPTMANVHDKLLLIRRKLRAKGGISRAVVNNTKRTLAIKVKTKKKSTSRK